MNLHEVFAVIALFAQFSARQLGLARVAEIQLSTIVCQFASVRLVSDRVGVHVAVHVVTHANVHAVAVQINQSVAWRCCVAVHHHHVVNAVALSQHDDVVACRGAIVAAHEVKDYLVAALVHVPERLISVRRDGFERRHGYEHFRHNEPRSTVDCGNASCIRVSAIGHSLYRPIRDNA